MEPDLRNPAYDGPMGIFEGYGLCQHGMDDHECPVCNYCATDGEQGPQEDK